MNQAPPALLSGVNQEWKGPLFVVGCSRSGTTLLQQILNAHSRIAIAPETHFVPKFWLRPEPYGDLTQDAPFARLVEDFIAAPHFPDLGLSADDFRHAAAGAPRTLAGVLGVILDLFARAQGADIVGEKTPAHVLHMPLLKRAFPSARFVHIVRDPRGVVNSRRRQPWAPEDVRRNAAYWVSTVGAARRAAKELGESLITVRYEDLVAEPETAVSGLCAALRIAFEPAMLEYWKGNAELVDTAREPWKKDALQSIQPERAARWRGELGPAEILDIEEVAWPLMSGYGYRPVTSRLRLWPRVAARAARALWRR